jgi:hypothetical protein
MKEPVPPQYQILLTPDPRGTRLVLIGCGKRVELLLGEATVDEAVKTLLEEIP